MYREKIKELYKWKEQKFRTPLLIKGAKRVGKTYLVNSFAKEAYKNLIYIFYTNNHIEIIKNFEIQINISDINSIEQFFKVQEKDTLVFIDDIENFKQDNIFDFIKQEKEFDIIITSSSLTENDLGFKVKVMKLNPLTFSEFLTAIGENELAKNLFNDDIESVQEYSSKYINNIKKYMYIGGMPEAVEVFAKSKDYRMVRQKQKEIVEIYMNDINNENKMIANSLKDVWNVMIEQLKKENKEFDCREIKKGAQLPEYEPIVNILKNRNYIYKIDRVLRPGIPITAFRDISNFEIFPLDIGILSYLLNIDLTIILKENEIFRIYKELINNKIDDFIIIGLLESQFRLFLSIKILLEDGKKHYEINEILKEHPYRIQLGIKESAKFKKKELISYLEKLFEIDKSKKSGELTENNSLEMFLLEM